MTAERWSHGILSLSTGQMSWPSELFFPAMYHGVPPSKHLPERLKGVPVHSLPDLCRRVVGHERPPLYRDLGDRWLSGCSPAPWERLVDTVILGTYPLHPGHQGAWRPHPAAADHGRRVASLLLLTQLPFAAHGPLCHDMPSSAYLTLLVILKLNLLF